VARMSSVDRRLEIVQAALRVMAEHGVQGATTRAIVAEAGMSLASFHYAFHSHDQMMEELIAYVVENQTVAAFSTIRYGSDIRTTIRDGLQAFFETIVRDTTEEQVLLELMLYAMRTPALASLPRRQWAKYRESSVELLHAAAHSASIEWAVPVETAARLLIMTTDGITLSWLADRDLVAATSLMDVAADSLAALAIPSTAQKKDRTE